jgi:predicted peroxiredoxin
MIWKTYEPDEVQELYDLIAACLDMGIKIVASESYTAWAEANAND